MSVEAEVTEEVCFTVTGTIQPAEPDVGISDSYVEDVSVDAIWVERSGGYDLSADGPKRRPSVRVNLLEGLDRAAADVVRENFLQAFGERAAAEAILEAA